MTFDPTKAPSGECSGIAGDFVSNMERRLEGLSLTGDAAIAFEALREETLTAIQKLENLLEK